MGPFARCAPEPITPWCPRHPGSTPRKLWKAVDDPAGGNRRRLLTGHERLSATSFTRMWNQLIDTGDPGLEVLVAYTVN